MVNHRFGILQAGDRDAPYEEGAKFRTDTQDCEFGGGVPHTLLGSIGGTTARLSMVFEELEEEPMPTEFRLRLV